MQVKHIPWICLSSWRSSKQKRHLSISGSMLCQIIINNQSIFPLTHNILSKSSSHIWCDILHYSWSINRSINHDSIVHSSSFFQSFYNTNYLRFLLSNSNINTDHIFSFLIDDGINRNGSFTSLSISNNQFSLSSSNWHQRINGLNTSLQRLIN